VIIINIFFGKKEANSGEKIGILETWVKNILWFY
jgi:hypothetical protein